MLAVIDAESTLTDRYQTTVPHMIRAALKLKKQDKLRFTVQEDGSVLLERATEDEIDPAIGSFLSFLASDIKDHPEHLSGLDTDLRDKLQSLVDGVEVDLDAPLSADDE